MGCGGGWGISETGSRGTPGRDWIRRSSRSLFHSAHATSRGKSNNHVGTFSPSVIPVVRSCVSHLKITSFHLARVNNFPSYFSSL
jgi:hypothetical protein